MQFLEWSIFGLRSARHVMSNGERNVSVTLFPMVHLGEPRFYEAVYKDAAAHDVVVLEGIKSPVSRRLTRAYRWAAPARLGLMVQPRFRREGVRTVHADLPAADFDRIWRTAPRGERVIMETGAAMVGLWLRLAASRDAIGRHLVSDDLPDRDTVLAWTDRKASLFEALLTMRDAVLCDAVTDLITKDDSLNSIAVIYGAGHMGVLAHALSRAGFRPVESQWMMVFES